MEELRGYLRRDHCLMLKQLGVLTYAAAVDDVLWKK